jgi:hypothetical protein
MNTNLSNITLFKNLTENEKKILCKTLAKIYTKRYLKSNVFNQFLDNGDNVSKVELGLPENFTIGGYYYLRHGWIADEKFKVFTESSTTHIPNPRYTAVWLDIKIGLDASFDKAKIDTMNFVSKRLDDLVFSCNIYPDFKKEKLIINLYNLHSDKGWEKIAIFTYSSNGDFNELSPYERSQIGEALGNIFSRRLLSTHRATFFPELNNDPLFIEDCVVPRRDSTISDITMENWVPDAIFQVFANQNASELKYEFSPKKYVFIEVKTGKYARFERYQKDDMLQYSELSDTVVLFCEVIPEKLTNLIKLNMKKLDSGKLKLIDTVTYSDF